jgi:hypothetical protein
LASEQTGGLGSEQIWASSFAKINLKLKIESRTSRLVILIGHQSIADLLVARVSNLDEFLGRFETFFAKIFEEFEFKFDDFWR